MNKINQIILKILKKFRKKSKILIKPINLSKLLKTRNLNLKKMKLDKFIKISINLKKKYLIKYNLKIIDYLINLLYLIKLLVIKKNI